MNLKKLQNKISNCTDEEKESIIKILNEQLETKNVEKECINLLDKLNERELTQKDVDILCKDFCSRHALFDCQLFKFVPKYISEFNDLIKLLDEYNDENEDKISSAIHLMYKNKLDDEEKIFKGGYWFYIDGVNWENWVCNQSEIIWMLKWKVEEDMTKEEQKNYLEVIKTVL